MKTESSQSNFLEWFSLALNTVNIGTLSVGTTNVKTTSAGTS